MLSLLFKNKINEKQDEHLLNEFAGYPVKFENDNITVFIGNAELAKDISDKLKIEGFKFSARFSSGQPMFLDAFLSDNLESIGKESPFSAEGNLQETHLNAAVLTPEQYPETPVSTQRLEMKPNVAVIRSESNTTPFRAPPIPAPQYVTLEQFGVYSQNADKVMHEYLSRIEARLNEAHLPNTSQSSSMNYPPVPPDIRRTSSAFTAKNELIANGILCQKCNKNIKDLEPISKLIHAVREHVMTHFDAENPILKRYECRNCPNFKTNFVDDLEKHLKKHGSMTSITVTRRQLCVNLITETHLKIIADLCDKCFPEVFEKTPPPLNSIRAVDTPQNAKNSVFPNLDRLYCSKFNIPYSCNGRASQVINID
uniref:C2H2-type domain-containing protein n=1 Tax=Caenorhabditis tropicalis TaxID=1561998 RepID=A0A1I7U5U9_9PELO